MKRFIIIIVAIVAFALAVRAHGVEPPVVTISVKRFEFTPNQITLKRDETVTLRVISTDRIHGFFSKELGFDVDILPNQPHDITVTPQKAGRFVVICDHFCGSGHGNMKMVINIE